MRRTDDRNTADSTTSWPPWRPTCGSGGLGNSRRWATTSPACHGRRDGCRTSPPRRSTAARQRRDELAARWRAVDVSGGDVATQVDHRLIGSVLSRVTWELDVLQSWRRDPVFHVHQALGPYFDLLLPLPPFDDERAASIVAALDHVPQAVETAVAVARTARRTADDRRARAARRCRSADRGVGRRPSPSTSRRRIAMPLGVAVAPAVAALDRYRSPPGAISTG